jgi:hypothetical protein
MARVATLLTTAALALLLCAASFAAANSQHFAQRHRGGRVFREAVEREKAHHERLGFFPNVSANWLAMPLDHQDAAKGTFQDKFYYDTQYWNGTGPCMMYLNGEGPLNAAVGGYMAEIAKALGACTLTLEHRWYGDSLPGALTDKKLLTSTLTVDQAMQDVAYVMNYFQTNVINKKDLTWFLVGGSYSGGMTVWLNEKYPGKFKASWAASGVVYATFAYTNYDGHVKKVVSRECGEALTFIMRAAEAWYDDALLHADLMNLFNLPSYMTKSDVMWAMADASASGVQYSMKTDMCNSILPFNYAQPRQALQAYAAMVNDLWGPNFMNSCYYSSACLANASMSDTWAAAGYSWVWECCNEMGWWQTGYPESIRSQNVSIAYFMDQCRGAFYNDTMADTWAFNKRHHGRSPVAPSGYIVATQGSDDPWSTTGLSVSQGPTFPVNTAQCTNCGHCGSMMSPAPNDPVALVAQRVLVLESLTQWLAR